MHCYHRPDKRGSAAGLICCLSQCRTYFWYTSACDRAWAIQLLLLLSAADRERSVQSNLQCMYILNFHVYHSQASITGVLRRGGMPAS